ncbi:hypothetical protein FOZ63_005320 [Perkinsus olseni]|uniref:Uncharacterized protein n=1 Tax=Perkinsus olseni TaxID=32597 RepID=A0A7J6RB58_PEROL|nr:hypothetical protein FOZ63_005320 [Perkinsus olseni]KAF4745374.1 hypothetical protein FOZ62_003171 [Perkinsus olseni]
MASRPSQRRINRPDNPPGRWQDFRVHGSRYGRWGCFKEIKEKEYSYDRDESIGDAPPHVKKELDRICKKGFAALKPSSSLPNLNGTYVGSRDETRAELRFRDAIAAMVS